MPRPSSEQVVVVVGASSGIGRETALQLGQRHAGVVLAARNDEALHAAADEVERLGGKPLVVPTDVSDFDQVRALRDRAVEHFGRIDTWVNATAASLYGTVEQTSPEEIRRVIDVTLLGHIWGMKLAAEQMRKQGGGTIVDVASALGKRSVPLQSAYCAAKHGLVGFAEAMRLELEKEKTGVALTTILPSSVNTPLFSHARSKLGVRPAPIPPVYEPRVVAQAILAVAEQPRREVVVGGGGKALAFLERLSPRLADRFMLGPGKAFEKQQTSQPDDGEDNLFAPMAGPGSATGEFGSKSKSTSVFTEKLELHPRRQRRLLAGAGAATVALVRRSGRR